jgi:phage terminase Nu1 subunit (DNA packaging protein)
MGRAPKKVRNFRSEVVSGVEAAAFLGLPERAFYRMVEEGVIPKAGSGEYILGDVTEAYWQSRFGSEGLEAEQTRLTKAKADLAELNLAEQRGEVHRAAAVMRVWADNVLNAKTRLLAIPTKCAPALVGKSLLEITKELKREISEALNELADYDERRITRASASLRK